MFVRFWGCLFYVVRVCKSGKRGVENCSYVLCVMSCGGLL